MFALVICWYLQPQNSNNNNVSCRTCWIRKLGHSSLPQIPLVCYQKNATLNSIYEKLQFLISIFPTHQSKVLQIENSYLNWSQRRKGTFLFLKKWRNSLNLIELETFSFVSSVWYKPASRAREFSLTLPSSAGRFIILALCPECKEYKQIFCFRY